MSTIFTTIQMRRDTAANFTADNPVLKEGELGFEIDTGLLKIGNGLTHWTALNHYGNLYAQSLTPLNLSTGSKTLVVPTGLGFAPNMAVVISLATDTATKYMSGTVTSYTVATGILIVNVTNVVGSGSGVSPWIVWLSSGPQGPTGAKGDQGEKGDPGTGVTDSAAIHISTGGEINSISGKTDPVFSDEFVIEDSADTYAKKKVTLGKLLSVVSITIYATGSGLFVTPTNAGMLHIRMVGGGAGGCGAGVGGAFGADGGDTTFGSLTAGGGKAGVVNGTYGGLGGTYSGTFTGIGIAGGSGNPGGTIVGGAGGSSAFGPGGVDAQTVNGQPGIAPGSGGSGCETSGQGQGGGGSGAFIEAWITSPAASYSYAIGAAGAGGAGASTGGAGIVGIIVIEAY